MGCESVEKGSSAVGTIAPIWRRRDQMAGIPTAKVRAGLRLVTFSWMFGICWQFVVNGAPLAVTSGAVMVVFGQHVGFRSFHFGILAMLPFLNTLSQLVGSPTVERRRQRK